MRSIYKIRRQWKFGVRQIYQDQIISEHHFILNPITKHFLPNPLNLVNCNKTRENSLLLNNDGFNP